jgi:hypothetical protein
MRSLILAIILSVVVNTFCSASPNDAQSSKLIIGEWQGGRHAVQYMKDRTWRFDPLDGTTHGKWHIKDGRLIQTWRFNGESTDSSASYDILELSSKKLVIRDKDGASFTSWRMAHPLTK